MRPLWHHTPRGLGLAGLVLAGLALAVAFLLLPDAVRAVPRKDKTKIPAVRWDEEHPGCTFSRSDDGHYHYGLWYEDIGITMSVDAQELARSSPAKGHREPEKIFSVHLEVHYRGQGSLDLAVENISLEFVKHFNVVQTSLDPDSFAEKVQNDSDDVDREQAREMQKHPERKEAIEARVQAFLKASAELQEFVGKNSLRQTQLGPGNPEKSGWVLFSTSSKWISGWKKQEEFILRVPLDGKVFEFPFKLPPKPGEVMLRKRE